MSKLKDPVLTWEGVPLGENRYRKHGRADLEDDGHIDPIAVERLLEENWNGRVTPREVHAAVITAVHRGMETRPAADLIGVPAPAAYDLADYHGLEVNRHHMSIETFCRYYTQNNPKAKASRNAVQP